MQTAHLNCHVPVYITVKFNYWDLWKAKDKFIQSVACFKILQ